MSKLGVPLYLALGNHDSRPYFREGYLEEEPTEESYYYSVMESGLRLIVLNTQVPGSNEGHLDEERLEWRGRLSPLLPEGSIIVLHHPVVPTPSSNGQPPAVQSAGSGRCHCRRCDRTVIRAYSRE